MEPTSVDVGSTPPTGDMKSVVFKFNIEQMPVGGMVVWFNQATAPKPRRHVVALETPNGIPAEVVYAAACKEHGCDCAARLGNN
ncbi:MAG: hypothetical protein ACK4UN_18885 [Limisphaerales bacterium]